MPLLARNGQEGGTNAAAITIGNSGGLSGTPWTFTNNVTGGTLAYDTSTACYGQTSIKIATGSTSGTVDLGWDSLSGAAKVSGRFQIRAVSWASGGNYGYRLRAGTNLCAQVGFDTSGHITIKDATGTVVATSGLALQTSQWYDLLFTVDTVAGVVSVQAFLFATNRTATPDITLSFTGGFGAGAIVTEAGWGLWTNQANWGPFNVDGLSITTDPLGLPIWSTFIPGWRYLVRIGFGVDPTQAPSTWIANMTDVSADVESAENMVITRGTVDEQQQSQPATCAFTLKNLAGNYSMRRAASIYWPFVRMGTPCQILLIGPDSQQYERFSGPIDDFTPAIDTTGTYAVSHVTAHGAAQQLGQGQDVLNSAVNRSISGQLDCFAYWSFEDSANTTGLEDSPIPGVASATAFDLNWAQDSKIVGSLPLPQLNADSIVSCIAPTLSGLTGWQVEWVYNLAVGPTPLTTLARIAVAGGTAAVWTVAASSTGITVTGANGNTIVDTVSFSPSGVFGAPVSARLFLSSSGGTVTWIYNWFTATGPVTGFTTGIRTFAGVVGSPKKWELNDAALVGMTIGHVGFHNEVPSFNLDNALRAYTGEDAVTRQSRLCGELGIPYSAGGFLSGRLMGPQLPAPPLALLQEAEQTDGGTLEDGFNFGFLMHVNDTRYNIAQTMIVHAVQLNDDYTPVENNYTIKNSVTVNRIGGASARYDQPVGQPYAASGPGGVGQLSDSHSLSLSDDSTILNRAGWYVHLGTVDADRYTGLSFELLRPVNSATGFFAALPAYFNLQIGNRIQVLEAQPLGGEAADVRVFGWSEVIGQFTMKPVVNTIPSAVYNATIVTPATLSTTMNRIGGGTQVSPSAQSAGGSALKLYSPNGVDWTRLGSDYPMTLAIRGQKITALARGAVLSANPYFETNTTSWAGFNSATIARSTLFAMDGVASLVVTPDGTHTQPGATLTTNVTGLTAGQVLGVTAWALCPTFTGVVEVGVTFFTAGAVLVSTVATQFNVTGNTWTPLDVQVVIPATATNCTMYVAMNGAAPPTSQLMYLDNVYLFSLGDLAFDVFGDRTVASGFGSDQRGNTWTPDANAADFAVTGGLGVITPSATGSDRMVVMPGASNIYASVTVQLFALPTTAAARAGLVCGHTNITNNYVGYIECSTAGLVTINIGRNLAGVFSVLATQLLPFASTIGWNAQTGPVTLAMGIDGAGTSKQTVSVWLSDQLRVIRQTDPTLSVVDTSLSGTQVGLYALRGGAAPAALQFDSFAVRSPATLQVDPTTWPVALQLGDVIDVSPVTQISL